MNLKRMREKKIEFIECVNLVSELSLSEFDFKVIFSPLVNPPVNVPHQKSIPRALSKEWAEDMHDVRCGWNSIIDNLKSFICFIFHAVP